MSNGDAIIMFGATGDLARAKLFPALYRLEERGALAGKVIGIALEPWDRDRFRAHADDAVGAGIERPDPEVRRRLVSRLAYVSGDYGEADTFDRLAAEVGSGHAILYYLAIPPAMFEQVVSQLSRTGLADGARILVEKPFGRDLASARHLNTVLHRAVPEESVYRIDHFLAKESVEHLLAFRYANPMIEGVWNREHIDHIQVTMAESFGIRGRGSLYETLGVVRDVVQNHLLQVLCLLTMESPADPSAAAFATERVRVLEAIPAVEPRDVLLGQYRGYRGVDHVAGDSRTPTYAALRLEISSDRWSDVPVFIRAGKAMATTATQAIVVFKRALPLTFATTGARPLPDRLVFKIGPSDGVELALQTKLPGEGVQLTTTPLSVDYDRVFGRLPLAYERVLYDAVAGDRTQFADERAIEEAWRIVTRIADTGTEPLPYPQGSWGPPEAAALLGDGRDWIQPA
ncbi:MAG: glucose-6-phosphate dehydrogenase [Actinobacteria bacterium]|nr:glucose-6-phosphate dehydrogenase [Actinomycetota bacterium]